MPQVWSEPVTSSELSNSTFELSEFAASSQRGFSPRTTGDRHQPQWKEEIRKVAKRVLELFQTLRGYGRCILLSVRLSPSILALIVFLPAGSKYPKYYITFLRIQGSPRITQKASKSVEWNLASSWTASRQKDQDGSCGWPLYLLLLHHESLCIHDLYSFQFSSVPQRRLISEDRCFGDWAISQVMRFSLLNLRESRAN